jgi:hypothetical protein
VDVVEQSYNEMYAIHEPIYNDWMDIVVRCVVYDGVHPIHNWQVVPMIIRYLYGISVVPIRDYGSSGIIKLP